MRRITRRRDISGFSLIELVMIIALLSIISIAVAVKWPTDMDTQAARLEFIRSVRFAQHMALTREWSTPASAWGIVVAGNKYYVGRADAGCQTHCTNANCADEMMCNRFLLGDTAMTITPTGAVSSVYFNGLGEPIDTSGVLQANISFTIDTTALLTVCAETGYVLDGGSCP